MTAAPVRPFGMRGTVARVCLVCETPFAPSHGGQRLCSDGCRAERNRIAVNANRERKQRRRAKPAPPPVDVPIPASFAAADAHACAALVAFIGEQMARAGVHRPGVREFVQWAAAFGWGPRDKEGTR
jgi:hypothetical protein